MSITNMDISEYKVYWLEFRPQKGIVTKKDQERITGHHYNYKTERLMMPFGSKGSAQMYLQNHNFGKLSKVYEVRMCADRQLRMRKFADGKFVSNFTAKQEEEMVLIGK